MTVATENKALELVQYITDTAIDGAWVLAPADEVAQAYLDDSSYPNHDARVDSLIHWHVAQNFGSGFATSVGGPLTIAFAIPAALGASWVIQARMSAAIAHINGYDIRDDRVRTFVLLTLIANDAQSVVKIAGIKVGQKLTLQLIKRIPAEVIKKINQKVGFRLITIAGQRGVINLTKFVPVVGGIIGGTFDATCCYSVGHVAKNTFRRGAR